MTTSPFPPTMEENIYSVDKGRTPMKTIYLAGGCYWGTEKYCSGIKGVV